MRIGPPSKLVMSIWFMLVAASCVIYFHYSEVITPENIAVFLKQTRQYMLISYVVISMLRGITLMPNTPLVLAGTLLFPEQLMLVLIISMWGILFSSTLIYYFSEFIGINKYFERKHPAKLFEIREKLNQPGGLVFVVLWAFFPLVPTDAVCYVAGSVKMNIYKFLAAVFAGEIILVSFYIWAGKSIFEMLLS